MASDNQLASEWEAEPQPVRSPSPTYRSSADGRLVSYARPCPGITARDFLAQAEGNERFYWEDVRDHISFAGFGTAAHLIAWGDARFAHIRSQAAALFDDAILLNDANPLAAPRLFGGFAFQDDFVPDNTWSVFHPAHFILPHYQFVQLGSEAWLTINALIAPDEAPGQSLPELEEALDLRYRALLEAQRASRHAQPAASQTLHELNYPMSYEQWAANIQQARHEIAQGSLQKVVLARVAETRFSERIDVDAALGYLHQDYADCYRFLFEPRPHHAFFGATPELLVRVQGATVSSMALAGSIGRSADPGEDTALGQRLLKSRKDRHEHDVVVVSFLERLAPLCAQLEISPQPGLYRLRNIQHLYTPIRGRLLHADGVLPLVDVLHPTPALGGSPRNAALEFIRDTEPVPRGWYAAPVGWIDYRLDGAFAVAIRSAVTQERRAWLYAGSGIVADSDPQKEWDETALKFKPMLEALGIDPHNGQG